MTDDERIDPIESIDAMDPELSRRLRQGAPALSAPHGADRRLLGRLAVGIPGLAGAGGATGGGATGGGATGGGATGGGATGGGATGGGATGAGATGAGGSAAGGAGAAVNVAIASTASATKVIVFATAAIALVGAIVVVAASRSAAPVDAPTPTLTAVASFPLSAAASPVTEPLASADPPAVGVDSLPSASPSFAPSGPALTRGPAQLAAASSARAAIAIAIASASAAPEPSVERHLIDEARAALARGDADGAMAILHDHERRFASGMLIEEREALAIRALVAAQRRDEAEARAVRFRSMHPTSLFRPSVEAAVAPKAR